MLAPPPPLTVVLGTGCDAMLCNAVLRYALLCYAMLCEAVLFYATLCYDVLLGERIAARLVLLMGASRAGVALRASIATRPPQRWNGLPEDAHRCATPICRARRA